MLNCIKTTNAITHKYNDRIKPSLTEINRAIRSLNPRVKKAIDYAYNRIFKFHSLQKVQNINYKDKLNNNLQYRSIPIKKVGVYVPANLPSTLLMNAIPAKIARVKKIILVNINLFNVKIHFNIPIEI